MEQTRVLSTKTMASPLPDANPSSEILPRPSIPREEGELSSSDIDENHDESAPLSPGIVAPSARVDPPPSIEFSRGNQEGKANLGIPHAQLFSLFAQTSQQPKHDKTLGTSQAPHKAVTSRVAAPQDNSNLVISFSDDESSSGSDETAQNRRLENKGRTDGIYSNRKSSAMSTQVLQNFGKGPRKENCGKPKQMSLTRTLIPALPKNQVDGALSAGQGSLSRNFAPKKRVSNQDFGYDRSVGSRNKLLDLRQQIALKESELKLMSAQLNKQTAPSSGRDSESLKVNRDLGRRHILKSAEAGELKEPAAKRLKVAPPSYARSTLEPQRLPSKSVSPLKEVVLENSKKAAVDGGKKASSIGVESGIVRWKRQDPDKVVITSGDRHNGKQDGTKVTGVGRRTDRSVDPSPLSNQSLATAGTTPNAFPNGAGPLIGASIWSGLDSINAFKHDNQEIQSLIEIEESLDKELEDAQEHRRRCEIDERKALKAYSKAQRALLEANLRCTQLYRQRELYSSRLRSFMMDDALLYGSPGGHDYLGIQMNPSNKMSENLNLMPLSSNHSQSQYDQYNQPAYASNMQGANGATFGSYDPANGQNIGSEPCSEPDASTSEPLPLAGRNMVHGESSPSNDQGISEDEDEESFEFDDDRQPKHKSERERAKSVEEQKERNHEGGGRSSSANGPDSLLEATLRSKLFARLGMRTSRNSSGSLPSMMPSVDQRCGSNMASEKHLTCGNGLVSEVEKMLHSDEEGNDKEGGGSQEAPILLKDQFDAGKFSLEPQASHDDEDNKYCKEDNCKTFVISSLTSNLRSAFNHMKIITRLELSESRSRLPESDVSYVDTASTDSGENDGTSARANSPGQTGRDLYETEPSSYSCDVTVDPFWPLCMYELRGKCNNDECPWQHIREHSKGKISQHLQSDPDAVESQTELASNGERGAATYHPKCHTPTYLVGLDILKANSHSYASVVARRVGQCWKKCFSLSLAVSSFLKQVLNADDSVLQNNDGRVELFGCWSNQSSYFRDRNCQVNELREASIGNGQSLESALLLFNQEADKLEGKRKALSVLSRALEINPTSVVLWIVYLVFYYIKAKPVEKDDLYSISVKNNQESYELWLMYLNSRMKLDERLAAYDEAISALTQHSSASCEDRTYTSSCILDLFLQMIQCLCLSGNMERAIQMTYELLPYATKSNGRFNLLHSNILSCLTISDKCVFWVCCVYLVVYRKLPDAIVEQFECDKELLLIEWAPVHVRDEDRCKVLEMVEFAVSSFGSDLVKESVKNEPYFKATHNFAVCHTRCMIVVNGIERSRELLDRYVKLYPTCLELVLMSAHVENLGFEDLSFHGFENALSKWPEGIPGSQCIWNQYAEYALQNGKADFARELMERWFSSVWEVRHPHDESVEQMNIDNPLISGSAPNLDEIYGFLNLSLHKLLQKKHKEAREAVDRALKAATPTNYRQCLMEHAMFLLTDESQAEECSYVSGMLNVLNGYLNDHRAFPITEPLSRKFIGNVEKPRLQQLIRNILCPVSNKFLLVNSVLESWFGQGLLPKKFGKPKDLVNFVEAIMEISPSNYPLAICVCKMITGECDSINPASLSFWASSVLVSSLSHTVPVAPEYAWVEAATVLGKFSSIDTISEGFYKRALSVHPFSLNLWKSYHNLAKDTGDANCVLEAAKEKGMELV